MSQVLIFWICFGNFISNTSYAIIAPILPLVFEEKGLSGPMIGIVFALFSVGTILSSPFIGNNIDTFGASNVLAIGLGLMGTTFVFVGLIENMKDQNSIISFAFILRFTQGVADSLSYTTCLAIAGNEFPDEKERVIGLLSIMTGLGLVAGPIIGSTLYTFLGF